MRFPVRRTLILTTLLLTACGALYLSFSAPARDALFAMLQQAGLSAFFVFTFFYSMIVVPFPYDVFLAATPWLYPDQGLPVLVVAIGGMVLAGAGDYLLGLLLEERAKAWFAGNKHYPKVAAKLQRYGAWAVVFTAVAPLPYSLICWVCGMVRTPFLGFMLAVTLSRVVRTTVVWAIVWW